MAASVKIAPIQQVMLNVTLDSYGTFIDKLRYALAGPNPDKVKERPVLAKETGPDVQPPRWIHVQLNAKGDVAPTVAIRSDNVYIMGFTNSRGTWYQLNETGYEYKLVDDRAVMLGFNGSYAKLLPDPVRGLKTLNLSRFQGVSDAAAKLWKWNSKANTYGDDADIHDDDNDQETAMVRADPQKDLRKAVATLAVAISEAARFIAVSEVISKGWDCYRVCIDEEVGYIMRFGHLSEALLLWRQKGYKDDQTIFQNFGDIGIRNGEQALAVVALVKLIIRSTVAAPTGFGDAPSDEQLLAYADLPKHGRYMAEVFSVRIPAAAGGGAPPSGTISFHGGHYCSDFIYSRSPEEEHTYCDSQGNIVLTGPSVAMSACSPIVFSLDLHDGSRGISPQAGRVACDAVGGDFSNYDRAIVETVETGYGPAEVIYAVLSNGVQGRVAMKLARLEARDGEDGGVLGRIVARSKLFDVGCVLFYNEADKQGVRVPPGELLPLVREALAVPLHMPLTIELGLRRCSGDDIVTGELEFNPEIDGQQTQRLVGVNGAELEVTITWSEYPW